MFCKKVSSVTRAPIRAATAVTIPGAVVQKFLSSLIQLSFPNFPAQAVVPMLMEINAISKQYTVGGKEGIYPTKLCVGIDASLKAAKTFAELGTIDLLQKSPLGYYED